jgi:hypothetical protein
MTFTSKLTLPSCKKIIAVKSITNEVHENLQKFLLEDNNEEIEKCFDYILQKCCIFNEDLTSNQITNIDKFVTLCKIKSISYSSTLKLINAENAAINIDLEDIINCLNQVSMEKQTISVDNICFEFYTPTKLHLNDDNALINSLYSINGLLLNELNVQQKNKLLNVVNANILRKLAEYVDREQQKYAEINFIPQVNSLGFAAISINPFNSSIFEILKIIYKEDLFSYFRQKYFCLTKLHLSCTDYNNLTPADVRLFMSFYNEEQAQQSEALKNSNNALSMLNAHEQV